MSAKPLLFSRLLSLRLLVVVLAVLIATVDESLPGISWLDRLLLSALGNPATGGSATSLSGISPEVFHLTLASRGLQVPDWSMVVVRTGLAGVVLYLVLAVPRMGAAISLLVTLLVAGALVVLQTALVFYRSAWLPLGEIVTLLLGGFLLMLFWLQPRQQILALTENTVSARIRLARLLLQHGHVTEALESLAMCPSCDLAVALQYEIALDREQRGAHDEAALIYRLILAQRKSFRDVPARLAAIESCLTASETVRGGSASDTP